MNASSRPAHKESKRWDRLPADGRAASHLKVRSELTLDVPELRTRNSAKVKALWRSSSVKVNPGAMETIAKHVMVEGNHVHLQC